MCGICGGIGINPDEAELAAATDLMLHRGPDEAGYFRAPGVALGMRRLSIIDLGGGSQPKTDEQGLIQVVFNGEIYNFQVLQDELRAKGHRFASSSDTEVIVHAYEEWGTDCFARLNGIFAIAIWDSVQETLVLARDHLGVKPLYYHAADGHVVFGSELKPLLRLLPEIPGIDRTSAHLFLRYQYVPAPRSIFTGVRKLPPGHYLVAGPHQPEPTVQRYWDPLAVAGRKRDVRADASEDLVHDTLAQAVGRQMISDVPLGAFLSGGVDSSLVVALMQRASSQTTKTFSIGFQEAAEDESRFAEQVARHLGTDHHSWTISHDEALAVVPQLPHYFDEPFADASAVPTFLVSQLARRQVTVSLSGDGGDELFGGYQRYALLRNARLWWSLPLSVRRALRRLGPLAPGPIGERFRTGSKVLSTPTIDDAYRHIVSVTPDQILARLTDSSSGYDVNPEWPSEHFQTFGLDEAMMLTDLVTYLPDDILTKVDRASMAHSLEARVPILDVESVELALTLPPDVRLANGPKSLLKNLLKRYIPSDLVDRPKHGFGIPIHTWLREGLKEYMLDYLAPDQIRTHDLFSPAPVEDLVHQHVSGNADHGYTLWALLMFQIWYQQFYADLARNRAGVISASG